MALHNRLSECPECEKRFTRMASLKAHITQEHFEEETQTCQHCDSEFETVRALQHHMDEVHRSNKRQSSKKANAIVSTPPTNQSSLSPFACKQCAAILDSHLELKKHSRIHQKVNSILSTSRQKSKKSPNTSAVSKPRFTCSHCPMTFHKPSLCSRHERVHTGERPVNN